MAPGPVGLRPAFGGVRFASPLDLTWLPDGRALVVEQDGRLLIVEPDGSAVTTALDLGDRVVAGGEQGLLSVTLDPGFADNGHVWIYYTRAPDGASRLSRVRLVGSAVEAGSELIVLETPQPYSNHNGGTVRFGPDGLLYLGLGDGGAAADPHGHGQNLGTLLGSMLRIYVAEASAADPYRIPADNPFVGAAVARWEIYAYGLRNPWRMAFDPATGLLWTGDVGQNRWEEVDVIVAGGNYGWAAREGLECFASAECAVAGEELPVWVYGRDDGLLDQRRRGVPRRRHPGPGRGLRLRRLLQRPDMGPRRARRRRRLPAAGDGPAHHVVRRRRPGRPVRPRAGRGHPAGRAARIGAGRGRARG